MKDASCEMKSRMTAVQMWIFGKVLHLCESWDKMGIEEVKFLHVQIMKFLKMLLGCDFSLDGGGYKSDVEVLESTLGEGATGIEFLG